MNGSNTGPKVAIGCGGILLLLAFCVSAFGAFHVFVDPGGAVSDDEAMPALLGGVLCCFVDFVIVAVGIGLLLRGGSQAQGGPAQGSFPQGGTQVMTSGSLPGAPPAAQGTPWHLITGCGSLFFVATLCLSMAGAGFFYSEVERYQSQLISDEYDSYDPYGTGSGGGSGFMAEYDRSRIEENQQYTGFSSCCCLFSFLIACSFAGATIRLVQKRRQGSP